MKFLPPRKKDSHKGDYGRVFVVAGSARYPGAAVLASYAAIKSGAGLVTAATPSSTYNVIASKMPPEIIIFSYPDGKSGCLSSQHSVDSLIAEIFDGKKVAYRYDSIVVGPGLGVSEYVAGLILKIASCRRSSCDGKTSVLIIDADGINSLAQYSKVHRSSVAGDVTRVFSPEFVVMTPHPAEAARLLDIPTEKVLEDPPSCAIKIAHLWRCVCVLKGAKTIVTDGKRAYINKKSGNPGMATAGSGDVLSGIIAAFACVFKKDILNAASLGVFVHGLSGDAAASELTETSLTASDIIRFLPTGITRAERILRKR